MIDTTARNMHMLTKSTYMFQCIYADVSCKFCFYFMLEHRLSNVPGAMLEMNEVCNQYNMQKEHFIKPYELLIFNLFLTQQYSNFIWFKLLPISREILYTACNRILSTFSTLRGSRKLPFQTRWGILKYFFHLGSTIT